MDVNVRKQTCITRHTVFWHGVQRERERERESPSITAPLRDLKQRAAQMKRVLTS